MRRLAVLTGTTVSLLILGVALPAGDAVGQQKSLKEQLVGTWKLVSLHNVRNDGGISAKGARVLASSTLATPRRFPSRVSGSHRLMRELAEWFGFELPKLVV